MPAHSWMAPALVVSVTAVVALAALPAVLYVLAAAGGWRRLAERFPAAPPAADADRGVGSVMLRGWCGYNGCVRWRADDEHLHLSILPLVAFFHRPLSIPWAEVEFPGRPGRFAVRARAAGVELRLPRAMVRRELEVREALARAEPAGP